MNDLQRLRDRISTSPPAAPASEPSVPLVDLEENKPHCARPDCTRPAKHGKLCKNHYQAEWRAKKKEKAAAGGEAKVTAPKAPAAKAVPAGAPIWPVNPDVRALPASFLAECVRELRRRAEERIEIEQALAELRGVA